MQNHRYYYGPSATMAKSMEKKSDGTFEHMCVQLPNTPLRHDYVRAMSIIAMLSRCPTTRKPAKECGCKKIQMEESAACNMLCSLLLVPQPRRKVAHRCICILLVLHLRIVLHSSASGYPRNNESNRRVKTPILCRPNVRQVQTMPCERKARPHLACCRCKSKRACGHAVQRPFAQTPSIEKASKAAA